MQEKQCSRCGQVKPVSDFRPDPRYTLGVRGTCRDCERAQNRKYAQDHKEETAAYSKVYRTKPEAIEAQRLSQQQYYSGKGKATHRKYYQDNKERIRQYYIDRKDQRDVTYRAWYRTWLEAHPDANRIKNLHYLARKYGATGTFTVEEWERLREYYGNKCLACGSIDNLTIDHVVPLSKGGHNDISNLQLLCHKCNCRKQAKTVDYRPSIPEWARPTETPARPRAYSQEKAA